MLANRDSRHPLIGLVDETSRLNGRLRSLFAESRQAIGLGDSEIMVLNAVVEAGRAPTVAQIARSLGTARQLVQRAANSLIDSGLIETRDNPDHKRSPLLVPTDEGNALKRKADDIADALAEELMPQLESEDVREAVEVLEAVRREIEGRLRAG